MEVRGPWGAQRARRRASLRVSGRFRRARERAVMSALRAEVSLVVVDVDRREASGADVSPLTVVVSLWLPWLGAGELVARWEEVPE